MGETAKNRNDRVICTKCGRAARVETFLTTPRLMRLRDVCAGCVPLSNELVSLTFLVSDTEEHV